MTVICDIDGVVYRGDKLLPGSDVALQRLVTAEVDLYFATNNSTKTPVNVSERISAMTGVVIAAESIVTSSEAAVGMLDEHEHPVMVLGSDGITTALAHAGIGVTERSHRGEGVSGRPRLGVELRAIDPGGRRGSSRRRVS